ncbi:MAG: argininosuccinate lyase [Candidatus Hecatellaceae archaeon]|nr:MAG: argininosuccinate lyase [Candidatus Hecatellales archaeon]
MKAERGGIYRSRLRKPLEKEAALYLSSLKEDAEIFEEDVLGTEAHVVMLFEQGIISRKDAGKILEALESLKAEWREGRVKLEPEKFEDVHELVEAYILSRIGVEVGGKTHTGRSRNDQVALDIRLRLRRSLLEIWRSLLSLAYSLAGRADQEKETLMVLYTHTQHAQVGFLSHYLLAYLDHLLRDLERIEACYGRVNRCPLGASALAGSTLPLNRPRTAELLGFEGLAENSLDAVSSRDFMLEAAASCAILMVHLSRMAEDLVLWSSSEFGYVEFPDELASPSSIMPQKRNPCLLELARAKAGRVCGLLSALLLSLKGVPTGYSRDLQETKPVLWEILGLTLSTVRVMDRVVEGLKFNRNRMVEVAFQSYAPAVDLAEALVKHAGLSLREAHRLVGETIRLAVKKGVRLNEAQDLLEEASTRILGVKVSLPRRIYERFTSPQRIPAERLTLGSPNPKETRRMLKDRKAMLREARLKLESRIKALQKAEGKLRREISKLKPR